MVQAQSTAARNVPAGGSARWPEAPPAWRPRRKYHYRNMAILVGFGCFGIALIVAAFITLPSEPVSNPSPPSTTVATTTAPPKAPVELTPKRLQSDPNIFFSTPFATQSACDEPPTDKRAWLRSALDTILSFGTRVGGSWTSGYNNTHHLISQLSSCERVAEATQRYWKVSWDNFTDSSTPRGPVKFSNIMAEFNQPPRGSDGRRAGYGPKGHLVLTAHWDSKWFADFSFLGACDSATPVAMLLLLMRDVAAQARSLGVDAHVYNVAMPAYTVMLFDGEEAFVEWRDSDNTYGSRHLATLYDKRQDLGKISLFMLLDLLGPVNPTFHNYFGDVTGIDYQRMRGIESSLRSSGKGRRPVKSQPMFPDESGVPYRVEDDHVPWMALGVPILHLIPSPFPGSWHNALDNGANIDDDTAADLYDIISSFALSYSASPATKRRRR